MGDDPAMTGDKGVELRRDAEGLALVGDGMVLRADFARLLPRLHPPRPPRLLLRRLLPALPVRSPSTPPCPATFWTSR